MADHDDLPEIPAEEKLKVERQCLEAAFNVLGKLPSSSRDLTNTEIVQALMAASEAADAAAEEKDGRARYGYVDINTNPIVCTAYAAWCAGDDADDLAEWSVCSLAGSRLAAFAAFAQLCSALNAVEYAVEIAADNDIDVSVPSFAKD